MQSLDMLPNDISLSDRKEKGELKNSTKFKILNRKENIERKRLKMVIAELIQHTVTQKKKS